MMQMNYFTLSSCIGERVKMLRRFKFYESYFCSTWTYYCLVILQHARTHQH